MILNSTFYLSLCSKIAVLLKFVLLEHMKTLSEHFVFFLKLKNKRCVYQWSKFRRQTNIPRKQSMLIWETHTFHFLIPNDLKPLIECTVYTTYQELYTNSSSSRTFYQSQSSWARNQSII